MKLVDNWPALVRRAHSVWAQYLAAGALITPELIYYTLQVDTNPRFWWCVALLLTIYGIVGRIVDQGIDNPENPDDAVSLRSPWFVGVLAIAMAAFLFVPQTVPQKVSLPGAVLASAGKGGWAPGPVSDEAFNAVAVPFVGDWEGLRLEAYPDILGVWTVCYGETKGVKRGDSYTKAQCDAMLARELLEYRAGLHRYFTPETLATRLPVGRDVAYTSLAYNAGIGAAGKSTATRRLNAGDVAGGCEALTWWNKAGGRVIRGLVRRRTAEYHLCMFGVA
ncbi:lysozyme [Tropicimonas marinistellae]|uniref:lysozyme n=1 Tax=Tropicimonas marinistellae TaxID=1739787 RepID=UPI00098F068A|nr:lysozyme [Tropicimonas marinistellae]